MAGDSFTEITNQSWLGRLGKAVTGIVVGIIFFLVAVVLLWWNEGRAVHTAQGLAELGKAVVSVPADKIDPANDQRAIHVTAEAKTDENLADAQFSVSVQAIKLRRTVDVYQWQEQTKSEKRNKLGGGTETVTTYTYNKGWFDHHIDSSGFKHAEGHTNPAGQRFAASEWTAKIVRLGQFKLSPGLIGQMQDYRPVSFSATELNRLPAALKTQATVEDDTLYLPNDPNSVPPNPASPNVGDMRISFAAVGPGTVSVIARQSGQTFEPWPSHSGTTVERLMAGTVSAENMVGRMEHENTILTWVLRGVGFVVMAIGIGLCFNPLAVLADVLPFLGSLLGAGVAIFAIVMAAFLSILTIGVAWFAYRPVLSVGLFIAAAVVVLGGRRLFKRNKLPAIPPIPVAAQ